MVDAGAAAGEWALEQELEKMEQESTCSICLAFYREPVSVECGHVFCRACILQHWQREPGGTAACPLCGGGQLASRTPLRDNPFAASLVASVRRLVQEVRRPAEGQGGGPLLPWCPEHDERLKLFCQDDQRAICLICAMSIAHQHHTIRPIKEAAELYREKLQGALDSRRKRLKELGNATDEDTETLQRLKKRTSSLRARIDAGFDGMQQFLSNEKLALITRLEEKEKAITQEVEENMKKLSDKSTSVNQEIIDIQQRQSVKEADLLLQNVTPIVEGSDGESGDVSSVPVHLTLEEFNGPLQYIVWKRMLMVLNPGAV
ncbi:E3 ubiquitin-protein ligase TRIM7-like isoform X2 [Scyliorhinus canicula]|uniref:E3 ubiquitin-protein ligase TRIM7-like isoform X2 n=1 Tax=Scyliorhinus canicula TaxID=7830 RepID=UPI0018F7325C|nr:E3 ubiquitin-protein ligase TRIM7-like isoform X2 [Scyliorhinus canicula]